MRQWKVAELLRRAIDDERLPTLVTLHTSDRRPFLAHLSQDVSHDQNDENQSGGCSKPEINSNGFATGLRLLAPSRKTPSAQGGNEYEEQRWHQDTHREAKQKCPYDPRPQRNCGAEMHALSLRHLSPPRVLEADNR